MSKFKYFAFFFPLKFLKCFATDFSAICFLLIKLGNFVFYKAVLVELLPRSNVHGSILASWK